MSFRLTNLSIRFSTYPQPDHYEGKIEYTDNVGGSKVELNLTDKQIDKLFPVVADVLVEVSQQAAKILRAAIIQEKEKEIESEKEEIQGQG